MFKAEIVNFTIRSCIPCSFAQIVLPFVLSVLIQEKCRRVEVLRNHILLASKSVVSLLTKNPYLQRSTIHWVVVIFMDSLAKLGQTFARLRPSLRQAFSPKNFCPFSVHRFCCLG